MKTLLFLICFIFSIPSLFSQKNVTITLETGETYELLLSSEDHQYYYAKKKDSDKELKIPKKVVSEIEYGCEYLKNEVDDMTGQKIVVTKEQLLEGSIFSGLYCSASEVDGSKFLILYIIKNEAFSIDEGAKVLIKDETDEVHELNNLQYTLSDVLGSSTWKSEIFVPISDEIKDILLNRKVLKVRIYFRDGYHDHEIKEKYQDNLKKVLKCI